MPRAIVLVLDSFGIGATPDAHRYGDVGANTFGNLLRYREAQGRPLQTPTLDSLGLKYALALSTGAPLPTAELQGSFACANEKSVGKDTPSGHWEMMGLPVMFDWGYFPPTFPSFPEELLARLQTRFSLPGFLGNRHASGTTILVEHGDEHVKSGKPIVYTSADSVFQIAAHETHFGLDKLYELCEYARTCVDDYQIGRVIARPFTGSTGNYTRTGNRRDYAIPPHGNTFLDQYQQQGGHVIAIGKISDIFAHRGIDETIKADGNMALFDATMDAIHTASNHSLIFTNFVDFDSHYGHRRDQEGYALALEAFDKRLPSLLMTLKPDDLLILTADHGCDPSWPGSDHTRENVPVLVFSKQRKPANLGTHPSFSLVADLLTQHLQNVTQGLQTPRERFPTV